MRNLFIICAIFLAHLLLITENTMANPTLFSESFGNPSHPPILLNAGAGNQSINSQRCFAKDLPKKATL